MSSPIHNALGRTSSLSSLTTQPTGWRSVASAVASFARRVASGLAATGAMGGASWAAGQVVEHLRAPQKSPAQLKLDAFVKGPQFMKFRAFAATEFSTENPDFLRAAHGFEKLGSGAARRQFAALYEEFWGAEARRPVNIPSLLSKELEGLYSQLATATPQQLQAALDKATNEILGLVDKDSWQRFLHKAQPQGSAS